MEPRAEAERAWALIVVNFGAGDLLEQHLVPSARSCRPDVVVVVDNFSSHQERERVLALAECEKWQVVEPADNLGFGGGVNVGVDLARKLGAEEWLLLNPDASIERDALEQLRAAVATNPLRVVAPRVLDGHGHPWFDGADVYLEDGITRGVAHRSRRAGAARWEWLSGACLFMRSEAWDLVGGFDEDYFLYWEDVDFSRRIVIAGGEIQVVGGAVIVHDEGGTQADRSSSRAKSETYYYYNIRNRMLFAAKHLDDAGRRRWRRGLVASAREILLRGGRRQFLRPLRPLRAGLRGVRDGWRVSRHGQ